MKADEIIKWIIAVATVTSMLIGGDKVIKSSDKEIMELQKEVYKLKADIQIIEYKIEHGGD